MVITRSRKFKRKIKKLPQEVQRTLAKRIQLFITEPFDARLNNHALSGSLRYYRSVNITGDYRLIYEQCDSDLVRFIDIDTHSNLYGT